jgi:hypothetical protein
MGLSCCLPLGSLLSIQTKIVHMLAVRLAERGSPVNGLGTSLRITSCDVSGQGTNNTTLAIQKTKTIRKSLDTISIVDSRLYI